MFTTYSNKSWLSKVIKDRTILIMSFERNGLVGDPSFCKIGVRDVKNQGLNFHHCCKKGIRYSQPKDAELSPS